MEVDRVEKPLRKLRKLLKDLPEDPAPEAVHKLRTGARRIEAVAAALEPADRETTRRLLKAIKPLRKAAGGVRDMDVLTGNLLDLPQNGASRSHANQALVRLIEHLGSARRSSADDLCKTVDQQRKAARRELKNYARLVESLAAGKKPVQREVTRTLDSESGADSTAESLIAELTHWPRLNAHNLHPFRLKVKQLRYVLQTFPASDPGLVEALGKVKDEIGDWHDWQQLLEIARTVLNRPEDRDKDGEILAQIDEAAKQKFSHALATSNALRRRYLHAAAGRRKA